MTDSKVRLAVFISGGGSGLQAIIDASAGGALAAEVALVVSSTRKAGGLFRAEQAGIESLVFRPGKNTDVKVAGDELLLTLQDREVTYIALAGYLKLLPPQVVKAYVGRIVNIHPGLLPKYGGVGMYGRHVHEAVLASDDSESGATVHLVDEIYDNGRILEQARVPVKAGDTPERLAARVLIEEHNLYPRVIDNLIKGKYESGEK